MSAVLDVASQAAVVAALVAGAAAFWATRRFTVALPVLLDLLLAAGLLKLTAVTDWVGLASAAATVAVRHLVVGALHHRGHGNWARLRRVAAPAWTGRSAASSSGGE